MRAYYLVPMIGSGTIADSFRGKYTKDPAVTAAGSIRYSRSDSAVAMIDATQVYLDFVSAQPDATLMATDATLDSVLTVGQANAAKTIFEAAGIPGEFINAGDTRRQAIRGVIGMFLFSQRMEGRFGAGFWQRAVANGFSLNTAYSAFPQSVQNEFIAIRDSFGWGNLGLTGASTLRQILKAVSDQFQATPFFIAGVSL